MLKKTYRRKIEQAIICRVTLATSALVRALSLPAVQRLGRRVAWLIVHLFQARQRMADRNLAAAFPDMTAQQRRQVRLESVQNICCTMLELLKLPAISRTELAELVDAEGHEHLQAALAQDRGLIILTAHYGNWEVLGAWLAQQVPEVHVVARDAAHDVTASIINQARASHGLQVVDRDDVRHMLRVLNAGSVLGILPDQHSLQGGVLVDFMGRPAWSFTGTALLAQRTGAIILPIFCWRTPAGHFRLQIHPSLELVETGDRQADALLNTRRIMAVIEEQIYRQPEPWLWLHNRWKHHPEAEPANS
jgi:KDO2-lipid IV(A) lauroyltransferase